MPNLHIRTINRELDARDEGSDYPDVEAARLAGVRSAGSIVLDNLCNGGRNDAVEVRIEQSDGAVVERFVISSSVSELRIA